MYSDIHFSSSPVYIRKSSMFAALVMSVLSNEVITLGSGLSLILYIMGHTDSCVKKPSPQREALCMNVIKHIAVETPFVICCPFHL